MDPIKIGGWITIPNKKRSSPKIHLFPTKNGWESSRNAGRQVQRHKARAEAAEKERDLHAEVGWGEVASGKWHALSTPTPGGWKTPNRREKVNNNLFFRGLSLPTD